MYEVLGTKYLVCGFPSSYHVPELTFSIAGPFAARDASVCLGSADLLLWPIRRRTNSSRCRATPTRRGIAQVRARHDCRPACRAERRGAAKGRAVSSGQRRVRRERAGVRGECADRAAARSAGVSHGGSAGGVPMFGIDGSRGAGKGGAGLLVGRARVGRQRHELRLQPGPRRDGRRVRAQRFLSGCRGRGPTGRLRRPADARGDGDARRNPRPAGRSVRAQEPQDRSRGARRDRFGGRVWRGARRDGRADRVGDRARGRALHSVPRDSPRAPAFGFEGCVGRDQRRSGGAQHAAGDARLRRPGRYLSQSAGDLLPVRAARDSRMRARSTWRSPPPATTSP